MDLACKAMRNASLVLFLTLYPAVGFAQETAINPQESFGLGDQSTTISAVRMVPLSSSHSQIAFTLDQFAFPGNNSSSSYVVEVTLPAGARVKSVSCDVFDADPVFDLSISLRRHTYNTVTTSSTSVTMGSGTTTGAAGYQTIAFAIPDAFQTVRYEIVNDMRLYHLEVTLSNVNNRLRDCRFIWQRTVSAAPALATFSDVPVGSPLHRFVEALAAAGITGGCGSGNYCPDAPLTRGQMAVFLATALGLHWPN